MRKTWWKECVVYQIYPRSFCDSNGDGIGDLNGITEKLDYLKELGVDVVWLSPVYRSPMDDNGYDISDYRSIQPEFGTMEDFDRMLAEMHRRGIRLVMDLVVNHTSDEHPWFVESRSSKENPYRDYYIWREPGQNRNPGQTRNLGEICNMEENQEPNNWESVFGGPAWEFDAGTGMYYLHLFSRKQPDLNWENARVRREVYDMMDWWCQKGIDGFRIDVISMISKDQAFPDGAVKENGYGDFSPFVRNGPRVHEFLREMNREVLAKYDLLTVGECSGVTVEEAKKYANEEGTELDMVFQFEHMDLDGGETFKWNDRKIDLVELKEVLSRWQRELDGKAWNSLYWCNHDQPRILPRLGSLDPAYREISAKMLATCLHMMQGTPYIYQGEELGMTGGDFASLADFRDIESINAWHQYADTGKIPPEDMIRYLQYKSRDNARTPMQWDDTPNGGFTEGTPWIRVNPNYKEINARDQLARKDSVFHYYQQLIRLRKTHEIVVYGEYELLFPEDPDLFVYTRTLGEEKLLVLCNFKEKEKCIALPEGWRPEQMTRLIGNYPEPGSGNENPPRPENGDAAELHLKPYEARVYRM